MYTKDRDSAGTDKKVTNHSAGTDEKVTN